MKTLHAVVLFAILRMSLSSKLTEDMLWPSELECIKELGMNVQTVLNSVNDDFITTEGDSKLNEYTECWYRKSNGIDENNEIKYDVIKSLYTSFMEMVNSNITNKDQIISDAVEFCKSLEGNSLGDRLIKLANCVVQQISKK